MDSKPDMLWSPSEGGFFTYAHTDVPLDVVEVPGADYAALLDGLARGQRVVVEDGAAVLADPEPPSAEEVAARREVALRAEAFRRINAAASQPTQLNMMAAASAGRFGEAEMRAWGEALDWIEETRARWPELAAGGLPIEELTDDAHWPPVPEAAAALAARF